MKIQKVETHPVPFTLLETVAGGAYVPRVRDLMTSEVITIGPHESLKTLEKLMDWKSIRHVPIVDEEGRLAGLVSQRDFLTVAISKLSGIDKDETDDIYEQIKVSTIMGRKIHTVSPDAPLADAAETMFRNKFGCLPVTDAENRLVGIITEADFVRAFIEWNVRVGLDS